MPTRPQVANDAHLTLEPPRHRGPRVTNASLACYKCKKQTAQNNSNNKNKQFCFTLGQMGCETRGEILLGTGGGPGDKGGPGDGLRLSWGLVEGDYPGDKGEKCAYKAMSGPPEAPSQAKARGRGRPNPPPAPNWLQRLGCKIDPQAPQKRRSHTQ